MRKRWDGGNQHPIEPTLHRVVELGVSMALLDEVARVGTNLSRTSNDNDPVRWDAARSEAERLFHRLLEICPQTKSLFRLNGKIPITGWGSPLMEIDLLCESLRVAIELDGHYHFSSKERYKLDRKKDFLLQRNGYFVIRIHTEDILAELRENLDTIIATIDYRRTK